MKIGERIWEYRPDNSVANPRSISTPPLVFLAGPIQGAPDWQAEAVAMFRKEEIATANPRCLDFKPEYFKHQVEWETAYLYHARARGVILFWIPKEAEHIEGRQYAQTTRFELGEHFQTICQGNGVLGAETEIPGMRYVQERYQLQTGKELVIPTTLADTVALAVRKFRYYG